MSRSARVTSIEAVRDFRTAMLKFESDAKSSLITLQLELRRAVDWIEHDRTQYWPNQVRKGFDAVAEARVVLERCEMRNPDGTRSSCYNEKKLLDRARRRLRLAQEKVETVKHWRNVLRKETEEFLSQLNKTEFYLESDWSRALTALERMVAALEQYAEARGAPTPTSPSSVTRADGGQMANDSKPGDDPSEP